MKSYLAKGHGIIEDKNTDEDKTAWLLEEIQKDKKRPRKQVAEMARECGLDNVYKIFYPLQSMPSHGHSLGLAGGGADKGLYAMMAAVRSNLKAIHFIAAKRINQGEATTLVELDRFLKVGLIP
jgi:hypothetical protein